MNLTRSLFLAIVMLCAIGEPAFANPTPLTTTLTAPSPGQTFSNMPSGTTYKADSSGNVANVLASDVPAMLRAGCTQPTGGGGGGGAALPYPGIVYGTSPTGGTVATSSQIQSAIGSGIYDASGAAAAAQAYFTAIGGILNCNGTGCVAANSSAIQSAIGSGVYDASGAASGVQSAITAGTVPVPAPALTGTVPVANGGTGATTSQGALATLQGNPPYYVTNYGAVCNGLVVTNLVTTAGSAVVTSPTYTFSAADVGKQITLNAGANTALTGAITTTTAGSNVITGLSSVAALFVNEEVVGTGIPVGTTIVGFASSTSVTISTNATATNASASLTFVTYMNATISSVAGGAATLSANATTTMAAANATFGTSDSTAIQAAMTAAGNAGGGLVVLPKGICVTNATLTLPNKTSVTGQGPGVSILKWLSTADLLQAMIANYVQQTGSLCTYSYALANQSYNHITNFEVDAAAATDVANSVSSKGIGLPCTVASVVDHMYVHDTPRTAIATDSGFPTSVTNNLVVNSGRTGAGQIGANGIGEGLATLSNNGNFFGQEAYIITGNTIINANNFGIFTENETAVTDPYSASVISNNYIYLSYTGLGGIEDAGIGGIISNNFVRGPQEAGSADFCIQVSAGTVQNATGTETLITGNSTQGCRKGLVINFATGGSTTPMPSTIPDKYLIENNRFNGNLYYGIQISTGSTSISVSDVTIQGNEISSNGSYGIMDSGPLINFTLSNNQIIDNTTSGLEIGANIAGLNMSGNTILDDSTGTQRYGIEVETGFAVTKAVVTGNNFSANATSAFNMVGTLTGLLSNNLGAPTFTISGACASTSPVGQGDVGSYLSGTAGACTTTILPYGTSNIIAPNGWSCLANDLTTTTDLIGQSASTTTGCTLSGTTASGDKIVFQARAF